MVMHFPKPITGRKVLEKREKKEKLILAMIMAAPLLSLAATASGHMTLILPMSLSLILLVRSIL